MVRKITLSRLDIFTILFIVVTIYIFYSINQHKRSISPNLEANMVDLHKNISEKFKNSIDAYREIANDLASKTSW